MQECSADGGATFDGNGVKKWNGDCLLNLMVPLDLSGPDTHIGLSLEAKERCKLNLLVFCLTFSNRLYYSEDGQLYNKPSMTMGGGPKSSKMLAASDV